MKTLVIYGCRIGKMAAIGVQCEDNAVILVTSNVRMLIGVVKTDRLGLKGGVVVNLVYKHVCENSGQLLNLERWAAARSPLRVQPERCPTLPDRGYGVFMGYKKIYYVKGLLFPVAMVNLEQWAAMVLPTMIKLAPPTKDLKMTTRTETLVCEHNADQIVFIHKAGAAGDREKWEEKDRFTINLSEVPDLLENGDAVTSAKAYGVRAFLLDRTSDTRKEGLALTLGMIKAVYKSTLAVGTFKAKREKLEMGAVNQWLVMAVAKVKGIDLATAKLALAKVEKAQRDAMADRLADVIAELKAEAAKAAATVDLSDI